MLERFFEQVPANEFSLMSLFDSQRNRTQPALIASFEPDLVMQEKPEKENLPRLHEEFKSHVTRVSLSIAAVSGRCVFPCISYRIDSLNLSRPGEEKRVALLRDSVAPSD